MWTTLKIPPLAHCRRGSESLFYLPLNNKLLTHLLTYTPNPIAPPLANGPQSTSHCIPVGAFVCGMGYPTEADWSSATATGWGGDM